ncbi:MAG: D-alanine--D-alanine ligase family protein [Caldisericum exile]|uniref:D-alanine--D-alanine ligase family protein n=1 Tax=Caldisericum exile TaxID=693075 RepID=UPI003C71A61F
MKVGITFNLKRSETELDEFDRPITIEAIKSALEARGHKVKLYEATSPLLFYSLTIDKPQFVFNIAEGKYGAYREAFVPALLDELRIPYTGSSVLSLAISMDKVMTKEVLMFHGIPTPKFKVFKVIDSIEIGDLNYPVIVKPIFEGSSIGITSKSICVSDAELKDAIEKAFKKFKRPVMVEEFIEGTEITVGVMGNFPPQVLPPMEIDFSTLSRRELRASPYIQTYKFKTEYSDRANYYLPARLPEHVLQKITEIVKNAFIALRNRDVARFDLRVDKNYNPYVLEVNPLPGLDPEHSDLPRIYKLMGKTYEDLINDILQIAVERHRVETKLSFNHE